ncbi:hypothetical protein HY251_09930, partial [bacterium]|nr:hypothetical protein [bacterium]
ARAVTTHRSLLQGAVESGLEALLDRKLALSLAKDSSRADEKGERRARDARELLLVLDEAGSLVEDELLASAPDTETGRAWLSSLRARGDVVSRDVRGEPRLLASSFAETIELAYSRKEDVRSEPARDLVLRRFLSRKPHLFVAEIVLETRFSPEETRASLARLEAAGEVVRGRFTRAGEEEFSLRSALERLHARTLSRLRKRAQPVSQRELARFLLRWQRCERAKRRLGAEGLLRTIEQLQGCSLPEREWEENVLPARVLGDVPALLDSLGLSGEIVWARLEPARKPQASPTAHEALLRGPGPVALVMRDDLSWLRPRASDEKETLEALSQEARAVLEHLRARGASFVAETARAAALSESAALAAVAELVRAGLATGDGFALLRALGDRDERRATRKRVELEKRRGKTLMGGRSRLPGRVALLGNEPSSMEDDEIAERRARALLERWGVLAREMLEHEPCFPAWGEIAPALRRLEARGAIRRGLFAHGLSGEQYALPETVERLRLLRRLWHKEKPEESEPLVLSGLDPLAGLLASLDERAPRVSRVPGARIVLVSGQVVATRENGETRLLDSLLGGGDRRRVAALLGETTAVGSLT